MALRNAVMAALLEGEASGYDLAKGFEASVANFWMATPQQIYRELDRMAGEGLVSARVVQQERRPNKRLFSLTEAGREAVRAYTAEATSRPMAIRDELMVKVQCVDVGDLEAVRAGVTERVERSAAKLARFERMRERLLAGRTEEEYLATAERVGPYLTLQGGLALERANVRWGETVLKILERRTAPRT
ncbi:PadR family transcriptional regulator [Streptomyces olivochromogenes]|uniref:PadR family transcriptional regulator n=1 Tax=Streptomyces olivochromogenes TaxID=1963 RepID=UPI001F25829E|nr:PadR family transcriptional regulator [Streptomyces olivochromogenes]MCF3135211.1 PadR family transcriptional regulator [Streptomyces olivochromogenes]